MHIGVGDCKEKDYVERTSEKKNDFVIKGAGKVIRIFFFQQKSRLLAKQCFC